MNLSPAIQFSAEHARENLGKKNILVISGAGISTESGIPDYRGEGHVERHPMTFEVFTGSVSARARYWARSYIGWQRIESAQPNPAHFALAKHKLISSIITQNVDGLHQQAGSRDVLELHGTLSRVVCMSCGSIISRDEMDRLLHELNPDADRDLDVEISPMVTLKSRSPMLSMFLTVATAVAFISPMWCFLERVFLRRGQGLRIGWLMKVKRFWCLAHR